VGGLTAQDFEIEDQGKKVPVLAFHAIDAANANPAGEAGTLVRAAARRQFLLLFDLSFSSPTGIMRAREGAMGFVRESLLPSDLAAVATFSQSGVRIVLGFTSDREQLARAIDTLGVLETERVRDPLNIAYDLGVPPELPGMGVSPAEGRQGDMIEHLREMSKQMARTDQAIYRQRVDGFLGGLEGLAQMLDAVQGRKQVVLLSAGFDSAVLGGVQGQERVEASQAVTEGRLWDVQGDRYFGDATARDALDKLFQALAASDTVLHTVDVTGLAAGATADEGGPVRANQGRDTLAQLAINTGGRFIKDANDLRGGLDELLAASRHYYVLAFEPVSSKKPGRLQKLKVRVKRAGLEVSHRRGYTIADPKRVADPVNREMQAAEAIAKGLSGGPVALRAIAVPYRGASDELSLPVVLEIDGRALLAGGPTKELKLEVFGYALDEAGRIYDAVGLAPALDVGAVRTSLEAKGLQVLTSFAVPDGPVDLRFLVREKVSGRAGSLRLQLLVPAFEGEGLVLSPPLAMDDPRSRLVLPAASRALPGLDIPFRLEDTPFTVEPFPTLRNGVGREVCVMAWSGSDREDTGFSFEVEADLLDAAGAARGVSLGGPPRVVDDADGLERYVLALTPKDVPAGRYALRVTFRDPSTGRTERSETPVEVH
jgi:VWFA-related protein